MAITANYYKETGRLPNNRVISTVMSNLGFEKYVTERGIQLIRTRVGDRYVLEEMKRKEAMIGGEQSGHIIYFDRNTTGDGLITSLTVLETMNYFKKKLSTLINDIPRFPQVLKNIRIHDKEKVMESAELSEALERARDILKNTGRILVRPSGTEPLIRIMIEGNSEEQITQLANELLATVEALNA